jgi:glycosyltransferase involved in cell wall biosynthesis
VRGAREVARAVGRDRPIVHAHGIRAATVAMPTVAVRRAPLVITIHGLHSLRRSNTTAIRFLTRRVLRRADAVLVLSDSDRDAIASVNLAAEERVRKIRAGVEPRLVPRRASARASLGLPRESVVVLWLGRLSSEKDPLAFVEAFARVAEPGVTALIAGDGEFSPNVARAVEERGLDSRIRLLGWVDDPGEVLGAADLFVSTSRWEGIPLAALEAAAAGLALVLTDVAGNRDLAAAGVPAVLVPPSNPWRLASAIDELAVDVDRREGMGRQAAKVVRSTFTPEALAHDVLAVYADVTALRRR